MKPEETVDFHVRWGWHGISRMYNYLGRSDGLSTAVGYLLLSVDKEGTPSTQLGPKMGMEPRSLTRTLKNMEAAGLIVRKADGTDKRKVLVFLTEKGKQMRKLSKKAVIRFNEEIREMVSEEKLEVFFEVMNTMNEHIAKGYKYEAENK